MKPEKNKKNLELVVAIATILGVCIAIIALVPAFGGWLLPRAMPSIESTISPLSQEQFIATSTKLNIETAIPTDTGTVTHPTETHIPTSTNIEVSPTLTLTSIPVLATPTSSLIPFSLPDSGSTLNSVFGWQPGGSSASIYDLELHPGELTIIAGVNTDQYKSTSTAPLVTYSTQGNFIAQVTLSSDPSINFQSAGFGIKSPTDSNTWVRIGTGFWNNKIVNVDINQKGNQILQGAQQYSNNTIYLRIERHLSLYTFSYSQNGQNWVTLNKDLVADLPDHVDIFFYAYSSQNNSGFIAQFKDFTVINK